MNTPLNALIAAALFTSGLASGQGHHQAEAPQPPAREYGMATIPFDGEGGNGVEILEFDRSEAGTTLLFAAEAGKDYMVWSSRSMNQWQLAEMAGCVAPGIYSAHVECTADWRRAFFLVLEVVEGEVLNLNEVQEGLHEGVPFFEELKPHQKTPFEEKVAALTAALVAQAAAEGEVETRRRERAACLAQVERLRLEAEAATGQTDAAIAYRELAEAEFEQANGHKVEMEERLARKQEELQAWSEYAASEVPKLQVAMANASGAEAAQLQSEIDFINDTLTRREERVALAERDLQNAEERLKEPEQDYHDAVADEELKRQQETAAWTAYQEARDLCDPKAVELAAAEEAAKEAEDAVKEKTGDYHNAVATANEQAEENLKEKRRLEAEGLATATAAELRARAEREQRAQAELERRLGEWKKFFDRVRELGGEEEAKKAADQVALQLKVTTETGRMMATALKALALGKTVSQAMQGITAAGMRLGYTALVEYAASVAKKAVANLLRGRAAAIFKAEADTMKRGESRFVSDETREAKGRTAAIVTKNADGTITVTSWTKSGLVGGGFREDVFKK